jgi:4'-phosphopantetheinyl transferase
MSGAETHAPAGHAGGGRKGAASVEPQALGPMVLGDHEIHVWCLAGSEPLDDPSQERLRRPLRPEECEREARFRFPRDRQTFLLARALVRQVLSAYTGIAPEDLRLQANAHGKPEMAAAHGDARRISFNVSHTDGLIALAVMRRGAIGIDTEKVSSRAASLEIAQRFFAPSEVASLGQVAADALPRQFFRYWTLKESYVKARGVGLSVPLDEFAFELDPMPGALSLHAAPGDRASAWKFWQLAIGGQHLVAVCAERLPGVRPRLRVRSVDAQWRCGGTEMTLVGESFDA